MTGGDEDNSPDDARDDDELASKLARLTEEQRTRYQTEVQNNIDRNAEVKPGLPPSLASTFLKNFPAREESEIGEHNRRQDQAAYQRDQPRAEPKQTGDNPPPIQEPPPLERDGAAIPPLLPNHSPLIRSTTNRQTARRAIIASCNARMSKSPNN